MWAGILLPQKYLTNLWDIIDYLKFKKGDWLTNWIQEMLAHLKSPSSGRCTVQDRRRKIRNTYRIQNIQPDGDKLVGAVWLGRVIVARKSVATALIPPVSPGNTWFFTKNFSLLSWWPFGAPVFDVEGGTLVPQGVHTHSSVDVKLQVQSTQIQRCWHANKKSDDTDLHCAFAFVM